MKKKFLAALICAAMVLTGCKSGENESPDTFGNEESSAPAGGGNLSALFGPSSDENDPAADANGVIDWDSVPDANEEDFELVSMGYTENFGVQELTDTWGISKYNGKEKIIKIPEVIDGKVVTALHGLEGSVFQGVSGLRIKTPGSLVKISGCFDSCDDVVLTLDTPKYYAGVKERPMEFSSDAFKDCKGVKVDMSMVGVGEFNHNAFSGSSGVDITLPQSVDFLSPLAFGEEIAPDNTIIYNGNTYSSSQFGDLYAATFGAYNVKTSKPYAAFGFNTTYLDAVSPKVSGTFTVPNNVSCINNYAFMWCKDITDIVLHGDMEEISENAFAGYDGNITYRGNTYPASEFDFAKAASEPKPLTDWESVDYAPESDFEYEILDMVYIKYAIIKKYNGTSKQIKIPETIEGLRVGSIEGDEVAPAAFDNIPNIEIMLPEGLTYMRNAFSYCRGARVYLPESGQSIDSNTAENLLDQYVSIVYKGVVYGNENKDEFMSVYYGN